MSASAPIPGCEPSKAFGRYASREEVEDEAARGNMHAQRVLADLKYNMAPQETRRAHTHATPEDAHTDALRRARALLRLLEGQVNGAATEVKTWPAVGSLNRFVHQLELAAMPAYLVAEEDEEVALARLRADAEEVTL